MILMRACCIKVVKRLTYWPYSKQKIAEAPYKEAVLLCTTPVTVALGQIIPRKTLDVPLTTLQPSKYKIFKIRVLPVVLWCSTVTQCRLDFFLFCSIGSVEWYDTYLFSELLVLHSVMQTSPWLLKIILIVFRISCFLSENDIYLPLARAKMPMKIT